MDKRKLQRTGGASLTITLPKSWIESCNLTHQQEVNMFTQASGTLLLKPAPTEKESQTTLNITSLTEDMITREATALYIAGVNEIKFESTTITPAKRSQIRTIIQRLIGFEIIDESSEKVLVRNILDIAKLPIGDIIDKMFLVATSMLEDAIDGVLTSNQQKTHDIADRDLEIDKLYLIITRQFNAILNDTISEEELQLSRIDLSYYRTIAQQLERIADHAVKIAETNPPQKNSITTSIQKSYKPIISQIFTLMAQMQPIVKTHTLKEAHRILNENNALEKNINKASALPRKESQIHTILENSLDRVRGYIMNMAEATIDHAVQTKK